MLVVGVISSPSRDGNTAELVREALRGAAERGAEVDEIFLPEHNLRFCQGCSNCMAVGRCHLPDDFEDLRRRVYAADGIIFGSPTYGGGPNAIMKNFVDRLGLYTVFTSSLGGKYVAGISTASSAGADAVAKTLTGVVEGTFGAMFARGYVSGTLGVARRSRRVAEMPDALAKARRLGRRVADDVAARRSYPLQNLPARLLIALALRRQFETVVKANRHEFMKGVYENLVGRGLIRPADGEPVGVGERLGQPLEQ